jgi:hypothetical protein
MIRLQVMKLTQYLLLKTNYNLSVNNMKEVQDNRDFWEVRSKQVEALIEKRRDTND